MIPRYPGETTYIEVQDVDFSRMDRQLMQLRENIGYVFYTS